MTTLHKIKEEQPKLVLEATQRLLKQYDDDIGTLIGQNSLLENKLNELLAVAEFYANEENGEYARFILEKLGYK